MYQDNHLAYDAQGQLRDISDGRVHITIDYDKVGNRTRITTSVINSADQNMAGDRYFAYDSMNRQTLVNGEVLGRYGEALDANANNGSFIQIADFNFGYQPISGSYPSASPGVYSVLTGDTLKSIAQGAYGDSKLWYRIAEANGLSGDADLRVGQALTIPAGVGTIHNDSSVFKPYDPTKITGDTTPNLPVPSSGGGCGGFGTIIVIAVAAVATVFTAGAAAYAMTTVGATFSGAMGAGLAAATTGTIAAGAGVAATAGAFAIGGAVGSIASQGVGMAIGTQDSFSWKGVALSSIGAAATGGLSKVGNLGGNSFGAAAARGAIANVATQGIAIVTGLQDQFNWRAVAASAAGAGVGAEVGSYLAANLTPGLAEATSQGLAAFGSRVATGLTAGTVASVMKGGRVSMQQVATDAFGNALGESIAGANGQSARSAGGSDSLDAFLALNDNFSGSSYTFADSMAGRQAANNPMGLPTSSATGDAGSLYARNGMDVMDDTTDASGRRAVTVGRGQGPMAAFGSAGMSSDQAQAMYGQALANGQIGRNAAGVPIVQPGQTLYVDLNDMSQAGYGGRAIGVESSNRAAIAAAQARQAAQASTDRNENYGNEGRFSTPSVSSSYDDTAWLSQRGRPMVEQPVYDVMTGLPTGMTQMVPDTGPVRDPVGNMVASAFRDPGDALKGAAKGLVIQPVESFLRAAGTAAAYDPYQVMADPSGRNSAELADGASRIQLPGSQFSNDAQRGGAILGTAASLVVPMTWSALGPRAATVLTIPQGLSEAQFGTLSETVLTRASQMGLGDDVFVQGSRAAGTARPTSDIDIAIRVSPQKFDEFLYTESRLRAVTPGSSNARTLEYSIENGIIQRGEARLSSTGRALERQLGMDVDISVVRAGGNFDRGPRIQLANPVRGGR